MKPRNWEEVMDELVEEKNALWDALDNLTTLWDMEASMSDIENSAARARALLDNTEPKAD